MAREVGAIVVGVVVGYFAGPQAGFAAASLTYGLTAPNAKVEGPRLTDLKAPQATYGTTIPYIEGAPRLAGIYAWYSDKRAIANESSEGGKGGPGVDTTLYTYEMDALVLLSINPAQGVSRIWSNGKLVYNRLVNADLATLTASSETNSWRAIRFYSGADDQMPDPTYEAAVGVGNAPAYRGRSSIFIEGLNLGQSGQLPVLTFEVYTKGIEGTTAEAQVRLQANFNEGTAEDISAYNNTPTLSGEASFSDVDPPEESGVFNNGITGENGKIRWVGAGLTQAGSQYTAQFRVELVFDTSSFVSTQVFKYYYGSVGGQYLQAYVANSIFGYRVIVLRDADSGTAYFTEIASGGAHVGIEVVDNVTDGEVAKLYLDGVLSITMPHAVGPTAPGDAAYVEIGQHPNSGSDPHAIRVDNVRIKLGLEDTPGGYTGLAALPPPDGLIATVEIQPEALDDVVSRLCLRTGLLESSDIDVTELADDVVHALAVSRVGPTRGVIETLGAANLFESVEGPKIKFVKRGGASVITIPYEDMGATSGDRVEPLPLRRLNDIELPARVTVTYANIANDFQDGSESGDRLVTQSTAVQVVELPLGLTPTEAKRIADANTMDLAVSLIGIGPVALTRKYSALEPTDVVLLVGQDGSTFRARILKLTSAGGVITLELVLDDATVINSLANTSGNYASSSLVRSAALTTLVALDIPPLSDGDASAPGWYAAAGAESPWPGAALYVSADDTTFVRTLDFSTRSVMGLTSDVLPDWDGGNKFDEKSSVTVNVNSGELSTSSNDALLSSSVNAMAIGADGRWEIVQFRKAELLSAGVCKLTGFLRGLRGTEWAIPLHAVGDRAVLLTTAALRRVTNEVAQLSVSQQVKAVTFGRSVASTSSGTFTDNGESLKPFTPADLRLVAAGGGTYEARWLRRTRLATRFWGALGNYEPLGETVEQYLVEVRGSGDSLLSSQVVTSSVATVTASSGDTVRVAQISAIVGAGRFASVTL